MKILILSLLALSVLMTLMGGLSDITGYRFIASKEHYWRDGLYLVVLSIALLLLLIQSK